MGRAAEGAGVGPRVRARLGVLVLLCGSLAACGGEAAPASAAVLWDSAGVQVAENGRDAWELPLGWTVDTIPDLEIGGAAVEDEVYQFHEVGTVRSLPDGGVLAVNGGSQSVRIYDRNGSFVRSMGGPGDGPGEFRRIAAAGLLPDESVWAWDSRVGRVTTFGPDGRLVHTRSTPMTYESPLGRFDDRSFLLRRGWSSTLAGGKEGRRRDSQRYARLHEDGSVDSVGPYPHREITVVFDEQAGMIFGPPVFGRSTVAAVDGTGFWLGDQESYEIRRYGKDGTLERIVRVTGLDLALPRSEVKTLMARARAESDDPEPVPGWVEDFWASAPRTRPAYGRILVDILDHVWVADADPVLDPPTGVWRVFDPEGRALGRLRLPADFEPQEIGPDYVLGVSTDELDVELVRRYRLDRAARAR